MRPSLGFGVHKYMLKTFIVTVREYVILYNEFKTLASIIGQRPYNSNPKPEASTFLVIIFVPGSKSWNFLRKNRK